MIERKEIKKENIIEVRNLHKRFGKNIVYDGASLTVRRGEVLTIIGGSGSGKSVMLKHFIGLNIPDDGEIVFDGLDITNFTVDEFVSVRKRIAMLFQGGALFDSLTVGDNVGYPLKEHTTLSEEEIKIRVAQVLEVVGLEGKEPFYPEDLSGGMKKRVGLARAIILEPDVILFDEPTTGLDPYNTRKINEVIARLNREKNITCIMVTHDMNSVFEITHRIAMVCQGKIIIEDTKENVKNTDNEIVKAFITGEKFF